ncbi:MAG: ferrochelatase, partial [Myxococcales bacterium]|nr:ferrochelatase [Myxococcales bacterium]
ASTSVSDVRAYLREFLSDPRVIDLPAPARWALLNFVILPFRPKRSAAAYKEIWTERGSPLLFHTEDLGAAVQERLGDTAVVKVAMRYGEPNLAAALDAFALEGVDQIHALPLFPQYASASTGSAAEAVMAAAGKRWNVPDLSVIGAFYDHPAFIDAVSQVSQETVADVEHVVLSFHGLPVRHCTQSDPTGGWCSQREDCCDAIVDANRHCYRAQCMATARALQAKLGLTSDKVTVAFQSRLGRTPWIEPHTDKVLTELGEMGVKRIAVLEPSFVADCLETIEEIGLRGRDDFRAAGGDELTLAPCVNASPVWADALVTILRERVPGL